MYKKVWLGLLTAAMIAGLTACGSKAAEETTAKAAGDSVDGEVTIHLMMSNSQELGVSAAVEAFNKAYEGKIKCEADYVAFNDVFETLEVLMSNKSTEYDIFAADGPNVAAYVSRGYLQPLNQWISDDEIKMFTDAMITEGTYKDQFYGAPMGNSSTVLYYNKALLKEAGINIDFDSVTPDNRLTWEQLIDYSKQALDVLDPDHSKGIGIFTRGISADDTSSYFQSGKILFYLGTTALPAAFEKNGFEDWGFTYIPCFEGHEDEIRSACGSWTIGMNTYSVKQEAAAEFIKYLTLYDGADVYINASGMVPALDRQFTDELKEAKPYMVMAEYEVKNTALVRAITPAFNEYSTAMNALWDNVRNGADVAGAVDDCKAELETAFKEYE